MIILNKATAFNSYPYLCAHPSSQARIEAEPVVHAHWECRDSALTYEGEFGAYVCSNCNKVFLDDLCQDDGAEMVDAGEEFTYCPYCGARMDEVTSE